MRNFLTPKVVIIAVFVWISLCGLVIGLLLLTQNQKVIRVVPTAQVTVVSVAIPSESTEIPQMIKTPGGLATSSTFEIKVNTKVLIANTDGQGLRFRSGPGVENSALFIALEGEAFNVKDGPVQSGDYTWWYLVSPQDASRTGWAAANFLSISQTP